MACSQKPLRYQAILLYITESKCERTHLPSYCCSYIACGKFNNLSISDIANTIKYTRTQLQNFKGCHCPELLETLGTKRHSSSMTKCTESNQS